MRSATSCSKTLIRNDWRRFWPLTFLYAFVSFFIMPVQIWNIGTTVYYLDYMADAQIALDRTFSVAEHVYRTLPAYAVINLFLGVGLAMVLFGYLMKSSSVGLMHALPVTRGRQFAAHFGAGMSMLTAANLLTFLLSLLMEALTGTVNLVPLLIWLLVVELVGFFFLAFGALCAMATGWLLAVPVIYFGLNFVVMAYYSILNRIAAVLWTGCSPDYAPGRLVMWLTPAAKLGRELQLTDGFDADTYPKGATLFSTNPKALPAVLIYALAGIVLLALAWVLYRARNSESAGDAIVFPWLRPVAKFVISIAAGLALGLFVQQIFFGGGSNVAGLLICQLIMGGLTYCGVEMLLRKSYKIFDRRMLLGLAALVLAIIAVTVCIKTDVTGYQKRVPDTDKVSEVEVIVSGLRGTTDSDDTAMIDAVTNLHRALAQQEPPVDYSRTVYFSVSYKLKNGDHLSRSYHINLNDRAAYDALAKLINCPGLTGADPVFERGAYGEDFLGGYVVNYMDYEEKETRLTPEQALALYRTLEEDTREPLKPEDLLIDDDLPIHLELMTDKGSYSVDFISLRCEKTLALLEEYGLTIVEPDIDGPYYGD